MLTDKLVLGKMLIISTVQLLDYYEAQEEDQSVDASVLLRRGSKILIGVRRSERMGRKWEVGRKKRDSYQV